MIIVGITGGIGHGKTSFARFLADQAPRHGAWETSEVICEVANGLRHSGLPSPKSSDHAAINDWLTALPAILLATVHLDPGFDKLALRSERLRRSPENYTKLFEYLDLMQAHPELLSADITTENRKLYRSLLQWLGGYLVKVADEGIWYDEIVRRIRLSQGSGNQLATVGGVRFPGDAERLRNAGGSIVEIKRASLQPKDAHDITERERGLIVADTIILNDGSLDQLAHCAAQVFADLELRQLRPKYDPATAK